MNHFPGQQVIAWEKQAAGQYWLEYVFTHLCQLSMNPGAHAGNFLCFLPSNTSKDCTHSCSLPDNSTSECFRMLLECYLSYVYFNEGLLEKCFKTNKSHHLLTPSKSFKAQFHSILKEILWYEDSNFLSDRRGTKVLNV